jgi:cytochrome c5
VNVPEGDPKAGKATFDELCATCHAMSVTSFLRLGW